MEENVMSVFKDKKLFQKLNLESAKISKNVVKPILQSTTGQDTVHDQKTKNGLIQKRQQHHVDILYNLYFANTRKGKKS